MENVPYKLVRNPPRPDLSGMSPVRRGLYLLIFEHDTATGKFFDVWLLVAILLSVAVVMLDSVAEISKVHGRAFAIAEWGFTILFSLEYLLRLYCSPRPLRYAFSFFGLVDLLAVLPTYISIVFPPGRFLLTIRVLRVLRVFRVLKLMHFLGEASVLGRALRASRHKIAVFLLAVLAIVLIVGSLMYVIEGAEKGFTSIPMAVYWAIVTLTTVGYGDIAPQTPVGQAFAAMLMITGYGIIAVPTGIVTVELARSSGLRDPSQRKCQSCKKDGHDTDAGFCKHCGEELHSDERTETQTAEP